MMQTLIKTFAFTEDDRPALVFSDATKIYLDSQTHTVRLRRQADGGYPLTDGLYVKSAVANPLAARALLGFQAAIRHVRKNNALVTSDGFRLHDGTDQFWWNGSAWVMNTTSWNTEAQMAANMAAFSQLLPTRKFGVVVKLRTLDADETPVLYLAKVSYQARVVSFIEDVIYRSLVPDLKATIRPVASFVQRTGQETDVLDLGEILDDSKIPFNPRGVDAVFDKTNDPDLLTNLFASYDTDTKIVTLSAPLPSDVVAQVEMLYEPEVTVSVTDPDFVEVEKVPLIQLSAIEEVTSSPLSQSDSVVNKSDGTAVEVPAPYRSTVRFTMTLMAPSGPDLLRLSEEVKRYAETHPVLRSRAVDEAYRFFLRDEFAMTTTPSAQGLHTSTGTFELVDVLVWKRPAVNSFAVKALSFTGDADTMAGLDSGIPPLGLPPL